MFIDRRRSGGFTLIELMIGLTIVAMILAIGVPSFGVWIQNSRIRNAADAIMSGITLARGEAVRRNTAVQFELGSGSQWTVSVGANTIQTRPAVDGSDNIVVTQNAGATKLTFNGIGATTMNDDGSDLIDQIDIESSLATVAQGARPLRVVVSRAGSVRMCDPHVASTDTRAC